MSNICHQGSGHLWRTEAQRHSQAWIALSAEQNTVVPGGRFNEMYGWDSYFIVLGLLREGKLGLAQGMVENFFYEIEHYGGILNANRTYYFTRSQPPFLSSMIRNVYEASGSNPAQQVKAKVWLERAFDLCPARSRSVDGHHPCSGQNRPRALLRHRQRARVTEQEDDSSYYPDVIRWLLAHPEVKTQYLVEAPDNPNPREGVDARQPELRSALLACLCPRPCGRPLADRRILQRRSRDA